MVSFILISWVFQIGSGARLVATSRPPAITRPLSSTRTKGVIFRGTTLFGRAPPGSLCPLLAITGLPGLAYGNASVWLLSANRLPGDFGWMATVGGSQPVTPLSARQRARSPGPVHLLLLFTVVRFAMGAPARQVAHCGRHYSPFSRCCQVGLTDASAWIIIVSFVRSSLHMGRGQRLVRRASPGRMRGACTATPV